MLDVQSRQKEVEEQFEELRLMNPDKVVQPDIVKRLTNFKMSNTNQNMNEYINEIYQEYLYDLDNLDKDTLKRYLRFLKNTDVKDNQALEQVDSFLLNLYLESERHHAIDSALKKDKLDSKDILSLHGKLLKGTTDDSNSSAYRNHNRSFVGYYDYEQQQRVINFFPLDYRQTDSAIKEFTDYFNADEKDTNNLFIKPFIVHGIMASIQVFDDGNTRLARLLQNVKLYKQTNTMFQKKFDKPTLYITKQYFPQRRQYRALIDELAKNPDNDNINRWIDFNLNAAQSAIGIGSDNVQKIKSLK